MAAEEGLENASGFCGDMMHQLSKRLFILAVAICLWLPVPSSFAQSERTGALDLEEWRQLADRAETVLDAAAASDSSLLVLRLELQEWMERARAAQGTSQREVSLLETRIDALDNRDEASESTEEIEELRSELTAELAQAEAPLRFAGLVAEWSSGLILEIDATLRKRRESRLFSSGPSPLIPGAWPAALTHLVDQFGDLRREVAESLSSPAQRQVLRQNWPGVAALLLMGLFLLTAARAWIARSIAAASTRLALKGSVGAVGIESFLTGFVLPVAGVHLLAGAVGKADILLLTADIATETVPNMAIAVFGASWLGNALFSDKGVPVFTGRPSPGWATSARLVTVLAGWVIALRLLADSMLQGVDELNSVAAVIGFPILTAGSTVLYLLGRRLSEQIAARTSGDTDTGVADLVLVGLALAVRVGAVVGLLAGAAGFSTGARMLVFSSLLTLALVGFALVLHAVAADLLSKAVRRFNGESARDRSGLISVAVGIVVFAGAVPELAIIWGATDKELSEIWSLILNGVQIGGQQFTIYSLLTFIVVVVAGYAGTKLVQKILSGSVLPETDLEVGAQAAITTGVGYVGIILAVVVGVSVAGLDLTNLAIVAGALSVGIGFGLQAVVSNFVSGIILLIERPINVGDWVQAGGVSGTVKRISVRSTVIETFDRAAVVVPNTDLMSGQVTNWTLTDRICRTIVPVGVAYGTDTRKVEQLLLEIAAEHPAVLKDPAPGVMFMRFGADALEFELRAILDDTNQFLRAKSDLNFAIAERFEREGISIPFPQRDVWIRNANETDADNPADKISIGEKD